MKTQTQPLMSNVSINLLSAKMLQSKRDGRLAILKKIEGNSAIILMDRIGERCFDLRVINDGFKFIMDDSTLVKSYFFNNFSVSDIFNEAGMFGVASQIYDRLHFRFSDLTNHSIYKILQEIIDEVNQKSGL